MMNGMTKTEWRAMRYAARYAAETRQANGTLPEPSDERMAAAFKDCVRPAKPEWYPMIREALAEYAE